MRLLQVVWYYYKIEKQCKCSVETKEIMIKNFKQYTQSINESNFYQSTLNDDYWKNISDKFPDYNDPSSEDCDKAVEYIFNEMKKKYPNEEISDDIKKEIHSGIS